MKFLLDVCIGAFIETEVIKLLPEHQFRTVRSIDPRLKDEKILAIANADDAVIITSDKDFGNLVYLQKLPHKGILLLRYDELFYDERVQIIFGIINMYHLDLKYKFSVYKNSRLRIRP